MTNKTDACGRVVNESERKWQACDNDERQHNEPDDPINQYRISRACPTGALSRKQPDPYTVAANCRWQHLIKECSDEVICKADLKASVVPHTVAISRHRAARSTT